MPVNPLRMIFLSLDQNHHLSILTCDLIFYARRFMYNDAGHLTSANFLNHLTKKSKLSRFNFGVTLKWAYPAIGGPGFKIHQSWCFYSLDFGLDTRAHEKKWEDFRIWATNQQASSFLYMKNYRIDGLTARYFWLSIFSLSVDITRESCGVSYPIWHPLL